MLHFKTLTYLKPVNPAQIPLNCLSLNFYTTPFSKVMYKHSVIYKSDLFSENKIYIQIFFIHSNSPAT